MINNNDFAEDKLTLNADFDGSAIYIENIDHDTYFKGGHWGQCLELLQHLCQYSENIILVVGEAGIGKTTLKQAMLGSTNTMFKCCDLNADLYHDLDELMNDIAIGFGVSSRNNLNLIADITTLSERDDKIRVLLIDNAHLFTADMLASLFRLLYVSAKNKAKTNPKFRLVLLGISGLEEKLEVVKVQTGKDDNTHILELEPLTLSEVELFLLHKWRVAGNMQAFPFNNATIKKIYQISAGNPREIEKLVRDYLAGGQLPAKENKFKLPTIHVSSLPVTTIVIVGLILGAAFLGKLLFIDSTNPQVVKIEMPVISNNSFKGQEQVQYKDVIQEQTPKEVIADNVINTSNIPTVVEKKDEIVMPIVPEQISSKAKVLENENTPNIQEQNRLEKTNIAVANVTSVIPQVEINNAKSIEDTKQTPAEISQDVMITADTKSIVVEQQPLPAHDNGLITAQNAMPKKVDLEQPKVVVIDKKVKNNNLKSSFTHKPSDSSNKYTKRILGLPNNHYTLQLLGASELKGIERFIISNKLQNQSYYYCTTHNKKPWYILIYGDYTTKDQAKNAIIRLPASVRALHPWARDFASVKKTLQTRK